MLWLGPSRPRTFVVALLFLVVGGFAALIIFPAAGYVILGFLEGEPFYDGKPLSYWAYSIRHSTSDRDHALQVLGRLGPENTEAVPVLIKILEAGWGPGMEIVRSFRRTLHSAKDEEEADARFRESLVPVVEALGRMGPRAQPAIPVLIKYLDVTEIGDKAATALAQVGPATVPELLKVVEDKNTPLSASYYRALLALCRIGPGASEAVPVLVRILQGNREPSATDECEMIVYTLGKIGPASKAAVPVLIERIRETGFPRFQRLAVHALGEIGPGAEAAIPFLLDLRQDACTLDVSDILLRKEIVGALRQMNPHAATEAAKIRPPESDQAINQYAKSKLFFLSPRQRIARLDEAIRLEPRFAVAYAERASIYHSVGNHKLAIQDYEQAIRIEPQGLVNVLGQEEAGEDHVRALRVAAKKDPYNALAWLLATSTDASLRDGKRAVLLATKVCELTEWRLPEMLDTLAAAYAEAGDFAEAIRWQHKALSDPEFNKKHGEDAGKRLKLYQKREAYRAAATGVQPLDIDAVPEQSLATGGPSGNSAFYSRFDTIQGCLRATIERSAPPRNFIWDLEGGTGGGSGHLESTRLLVICSPETLDSYLRTLQKTFKERAQETDAEITEAREILEDGHVANFRFQYTSGAARGEVAAHVTSQELDPDDARQRIYHVSVTAEEKHP